MRIERRNHQMVKKSTITFAAILLIIYTGCPGNKKEELTKISEPKRVGPIIPLVINHENDNEPTSGQEETKIAKNKNKRTDEKEAYDNCIALPPVDNSNHIVVQRDYALRCYEEGEYLHSRSEEFVKLVALDLKKFLYSGYSYSAIFLITGHADGLVNSGSKKWGDVPIKNSRNPGESIYDPDLAEIRALIIRHELKSAILNLPVLQLEEVHYEMGELKDIPDHGDNGPYLRKVEISVSITKSDIRE